MGKCLLSIDWDYFICSKVKRYSYIENSKNVLDVWYKRYFVLKRQGKDIKDLYSLFPEVRDFWEKIRQKFIIKPCVKVYISDSHVLSYNIARDTRCTSVYLFDAHADLGYGGLHSLNFELNCANWLGKLLKDGVIQKANIVYSPYTLEKPHDFKEINGMYNVEYITRESIPTGIEVAAVHICRSGAWTPPWYDAKFLKFVRDSGLSNLEFIDFFPRKWDTRNISLSQQINYMLA
ncbi:arginase [Caldicoprobacter algeriensis]|nr:arginase [Caldicoprobacter algeriensis]